MFFVGVGWDKSGQRLDFIHVHICEVVSRVLNGHIKPPVTDEDEVLLVKVKKTGNVLEGLNELNCQKIASDFTLQVLSVVRRCLCIQYQKSRSSSNAISWLFQ